MRRSGERYRAHDANKCFRKKVGALRNTPLLNRENLIYFSVRCKWLWIAGNAIQDDNGKELERGESSI